MLIEEDHEEDTKATSEAELRKVEREGGRMEAREARAGRRGGRAFLWRRGPGRSKGQGEIERLGGMTIRMATATATRRMARIRME